MRKTGFNVTDTALTLLSSFLYFLCNFFIQLSVDSNLHNPPRLAFAICGLCRYLFFVTIKVLEINKVEVEVVEVKMQIFQLLLFRQYNLLYARPRRFSSSFCYVH